MRFADKLELLMNITNTSNSRLARHVSLDASFVSRLRRGERSPAHGVSYIQAMSYYFARGCQADYQRVALAEAIRDPSLLKEGAPESLAIIIEGWLRGDHDVIDEFMDEFSRFQFKKASGKSEPPPPLPDIDNGIEAAVELYYGTEGKRSAVLSFLARVLQEQKPRTLLLFSDEDLAWMTDDPEFTARWGHLMVQVLQAGHQVKIIHTITRNLDEMLAGIKGWVPLYMTGRVEPYYYPKARDGLFRRTLFIAPDCAALTCSSVRGGSAQTVNLLLREMPAVAALTLEYNDFLALCRPLMHIFSHYNQDDYLSTLAEFEDEAGDSIVKTGSPSTLSMPAELLASITARSEDPAAARLILHQQRRSTEFHHRLQESNFTEMFCLPRLEAILAGEVAVSLYDIPDNAETFYTPGEFLLHLENIIRLLKNCANYHVHLAGAGQLAGSMLYVKEDVGVLVGKTALPPVVFAINEANLTAAFWDYMQGLLGDKHRDLRSRSRTIDELEDLAARLKAELAALELS